MDEEELSSSRKKIELVGEPKDDENAKPKTFGVGDVANRSGLLDVGGASRAHYGKEGIHLQWEGITYEVEDRNNKGETKTVLSNVSGYARPGEFLAILGPSGSGKSSLLNVLSQRITDSVIGNVTVNGEALPVNFQTFTGYVTQDELYFQALTVRETLGFTADLKLPSKMSKHDKLARIEEVIELLDLQQCVDTRIGNVGEGISGGERRRLAIGLEILNSPPLLMLDEPTSGLDSASALMVTHILRRLATELKITVVAVVHQPRMTLCKLFDRIMLLGQGNVLYSGPTVPDCLGYFEEAGFKCPPFENPADFMLDLVNTKDDAQSGSALTSDMTRNDTIQLLLKHYNAKKEPLPTRSEMPPPYASPNTSKYITGFFNQFWVVFRRALIHKFREPLAAMTQFFNAVIMGVIIGGIYWQIDKSQAGMYDRISLLSFGVLMISFMPFDELMLFPQIRKIYLREQESGMYRSSAFYFGRTFADVPYHVTFAFLFGLILYWMAGLENNADKFLTWCAIIQCEMFCGASMLIAIGSLAKDLEMSNLLATFFLLLFMITDGNWIQLDKIPIFLRWLRHVSFLGLGVQAACKSEFTGLVVECDEKEIALGVCMFETGEQVLQSRAMFDVDISYNCLIICVIGVIWRIIAYLGLRFCFTGKTFKERLYS